MNKVRLVHLMLEQIFGLLLIIYQHLKREHIYKFLLNLSKFDKVVQEFKWACQVKNNFKYTNAIIGHVIFIVGATFSTYSLRGDAFIFTTIAIIIILIFMVIAGQFNISVLSVNKRLNILYKNVE